MEKEQVDLIVDNLSKRFGPFTAVNGISFTVKRLECFGLLGINGAGKTTTFNMLTGELPATSGDAHVKGIGLQEKRFEYLQHIGYCPQFDALIDNLTAEEMICLFARLRGIPENLLKFVVRSLIHIVDLQDHYTRPCQWYSGGNKRKLSLAISIIGRPRLVFLDEPTSGVDPSARRKIWQALTLLQRYSHCGLVLTTHSMDECEALCSRTSIMVGGMLRCLGSIQHLRSKFGQGFSLVAKLGREDLEKHEKTSVDKVTKWMGENFKQVTLRDSHRGVLQFHLGDKNLKWSSAFKIMERGKEDLHLEDYHLSDTTLESIFLSFARKNKK